MVQRHRGCTRKLLQNTKLQRMRTTHSSFQYFFHGMVFHTGPFFLSFLRNFFKECRIRMKRRYGIFLQRFMHHPILCCQILFTLQSITFQSGFQLLLLPFMNKAKDAEFCADGTLPDYEMSLLYIHTSQCVEKSHISLFIYLQVQKNMP